MDTRKTTKEYRLAHWAGVLQERQKSGLSIKAFCEKSGFHQSIYYYWQQKLREEASKESAGHALNQTMEQMMVPNRLTDNHAPYTAMPPGWVSCEIITNKPEANGLPKSNAVHIEIGKFRITVEASPDLKLLAAVCQTLVSLC